MQAITEEVSSTVGVGKVADYVPALARVAARQFGIALHRVDGQAAAAGDAQVPFSTQSVSKVLRLTLALQALGSELWRRVGREPSGNPFNSLVRLEREQGQPRNPFIKSFGQIDNDVETVLQLYCRQCAIVANCAQLAQAFGYLAHGGLQPGNGGAIAAVVPGRMVLCAWSPALDDTGNSVAARLALELFVAKTGLSIF